VITNLTKYIKKVIIISANGGSGTGAQYKNRDSFLYTFNKYTTAHSSSGLGHVPLKDEITGSNPVCATNHFIPD
jgi:hypothetical protein